MNTATIEELAYLIKQAKEEGQPKPIVFLGAGASKTGGIPLANEIVDDVLDRYKDSPKIKTLKDEDKTYPKLMACLTPYERNKLLKGYIDAAKINVTHIYLAQFIKLGYLDYILTVNFDNLMLRALALFNEFPPTYDMAILKDLTTTSFKEKSVVYLHGQHHGLWLLNTAEEMGKVTEIVPSILHSIKDQRPWIFIGYSGQDPIFEHIEQLGRFDNGLYWVTYYGHDPNKTVCKQLLEKPNSNAYLIKGYDADSFILKLNSELKLPQPLIIDKPFTSLKNALDNIVDIDDEKDHFKGVKERLEIVKHEVDKAIQHFEEGKIALNEGGKKDFDLRLIKKQIIDLIANEDYDEEKINALAAEAGQLNVPELNESLSDLFNNWGVMLFDKAKQEDDKAYYEQSFDKYQKAIALNPKYEKAFRNWGAGIISLAKRNSGVDREKLLNQAVSVLENAVKFGGSAYNLACAYALKNERKKAFEHLENCLNNNEIRAAFVKSDGDWQAFFGDVDFMSLIEKYK